MKLKKFKINITDLVLISVFILIAVMMIYKSYASTSTGFETNYSPDQINKIMLTQYSKTPLSKEFNGKTFSSKVIMAKYKTLDFLSNNFIGKYFINTYNKSSFDSSSCSSCSTTDSCSDSEKSWYYYPVDIENKDLNNKILHDKELLIIDVRNQDAYLEKHIPSSVNMPMTEMVDIMSVVDRDTEIVVAGESYIQTKIASEALQRLNFHRVHRLVPAVDKWNGEFESFS
jgi:rhodanese-related sulfurtransferase